jgi:hypothetical protein
VSLSYSGSVGSCQRLCLSSPHTRVVPGFPVVKRRKHPANVRPSKTAVMRVVEEISVVVPVNKLIPKAGKEGCKGQYGDNNRREPGAAFK